MTCRTSILIALLAASASAQMLDSRFLLDLQAARDPLLAHPNLIRLWTREAAESLELSGSNVVSWTDIKNGVRATNLTESARPYVRTSPQGLDEVYFDGADWLDFPAVASTNVTILVAGTLRADQTFYSVGSSLSEGGFDKYGPAVAGGVFYMRIGGSGNGAMVYGAVAMPTGTVIYAGSYISGDSADFIGYNATGVTNLSAQLMTGSPGGTPLLGRIGGRGTAQGVQGLALVALFSPAIPCAEACDLILHTNRKYRP